MCTTIQLSGNWKSLVSMNNYSCYTALQYLYFTCFGAKVSAYMTSTMFAEWAYACEVNNTSHGISLRFLACKLYFAVRHTRKTNFEEIIT